MAAGSIDHDISTISPNVKLELCESQLNAIINQRLKFHETTIFLGLSYGLPSWFSYGCWVRFIPLNPIQSAIRLLKSHSAINHEP